MPEGTFSTTRGVLETVVGYTGGTTENPTYDNMGDHTEALRVTFDPRILPPELVLRLFWTGHTPLPLSFTGAQYRSALFYHTEHQRIFAEVVRKLMEREGGGLLASQLELTALEPAGPFYRAEEYHQQFLRKQRASAIQWSPTI